MDLGLTVTCNGDGRSSKSYEEVTQDRVHDRQEARVLGRVSPKVGP